MRTLTAVLSFVFIPTGFALAQTDSWPVRTNENIIVAAYNIQWLGNMGHDLDKLAEVIQHFDVCGIVEVKKEPRLRELVAALESKTGHDWGYVFGLRTHRPSGNYHEAGAAVWRRDRVEIGDGVVSNIWDLEEAFRNDPFIVSFKRGNFDFTLFLVHTRWSDDDEGSRDGEIGMIGEQLLWMRDFMSERDWLVAGDFNYPGSKKVMEDMAEETDLVQLDSDPKSTFKRNLRGYASSYDHIYVFDGETTEYEADSCDTLDVTKLVYGSNSVANMRKSKRELSDHLPVFAIFDVTQADDD